MFEVGKTVVWYPGWVQQSERYGSRVLVKVLRVARNGITIEVLLDNGETQKIRVSRHWLRHIPPKPYRPDVPRPFQPPGKPRLIYVNPEHILRSQRANCALRIVPGPN
jgi:hypothetical protein